MRWEESGTRFAIRNRKSACRADTEFVDSSPWRFRYFDSASFSSRPTAHSNFSFVPERLSKRQGDFQNVLQYLMCSVTQRQQQNDQRARDVYGDGVYHNGNSKASAAPANNHRAHLRERGATQPPELATVTPVLRRGHDQRVPNLARGHRLENNLHAHVLTVPGRTRRRRYLDKRRQRMLCQEAVED